MTCPRCGGTKFVMGTDGTARYAAVAVVCVGCGHVEVTTVDLEADEVAES